MPKIADYLKKTPIKNISRKGSEIKSSPILVLNALDHAKHTLSDLIGNKNLSELERKLLKELSESLQSLPSTKADAIKFGKQHVSVFPSRNAIPEQIQTRQADLIKKMETWLAYEPKLKDETSTTFVKSAIFLIYSLIDFIEYKTLDYDENDQPIEKDHTYHKYDKKLLFTIIKHDQKEAAHNSCKSILEKCRKFQDKEKELTKSNETTTTIKTINKKEEEQATTTNSPSSLAIQDKQTNELLISKINRLTQLSTLIEGIEDPILNAYSPETTFKTDFFEEYNSEEKFTQLMQDLNLNESEQETWLLEYHQRCPSSPHYSSLWSWSHYLNPIGSQYKLTLASLNEQWNKSVHDLFKSLDNPDNDHSKPNRPTNAIEWLREKKESLESETKNKSIPPVTYNLELYNSDDNLITEKDKLEEHYQVGIQTLQSDINRIELLKEANALLTQNSNQKRSNFPLFQMQKELFNQLLSILPLNPKQKKQWIKTYSIAQNAEKYKPKKLLQSILKLMTNKIKPKLIVGRYMNQQFPIQNLEPVLTEKKSELKLLQDNKNQSQFNNLELKEKIQIILEQQYQNYQENSQSTDITQPQKSPKNKSVSKSLTKFKFLSNLWRKTRSSTQQFFKKCRRKMSNFRVPAMRISIDDKVNKNRAKPKNATDLIIKSNSKEPIIKTNKNQEAANPLPAPEDNPITTLIRTL